MKPFDLEAAKRGDPIVTRDGKVAKFAIHIPEANDEERVIASVDRNVLTFHENGRFVETRESHWDLFMASRKVYVNLYRCDDLFEYIGSRYETKEKADQGKMWGRVACVEIEE